MIRGNFDQGGGISSCISGERRPEVKRTHSTKGKGKKMTRKACNCFAFSERLNMNFFSINVELELTQSK